MKVLEREKILHSVAKEKTLYVFTKCKNAWLGFFENGDFWAVKKSNTTMFSKLQTTQVNLLKETEFTSEQTEQAYIKYNKNWFNSFSDELVSKRVKYTGAVLTDEGALTLYSKLKHLIPEGWRVVNHHMTLCLGELNAEKQSLLGKESKLKVVGYSLDIEKGAFAVKVESEFESKSKYKHVTFALAEGIKAVTSNELTKFVDFEMEEINVVVSYVLNNNETRTVPFK